MNRSKKIRSSLRDQGINPNQKIYIGVRHSNNSATIMLDQKCGRAVYQNLKKEQN